VNKLLGGLNVVLVVELDAGLVIEIIVGLHVIALVVLRCGVVSEKAPDGVLRL
jgi:hypothetical protein